MKKNEEKELFLLLAHDEDESGEKDIWFLDTNTGNHMCGQRNMFMDLDEIVGSKVKFGHSSKVSIKVKGKIIFA